MALSIKDAEPIVAKAKAERRRFRRVRVDLSGRLFTPGDGKEARCTIINLSPGGAAIDCEIVPDHGIAVVLYVDAFGRFEGTVARREGHGFGVSFVCTSAKRERTAEQLTLFLNKALVENIRLYGLKQMKTMPPFHDLLVWFAEHQVDPRGLLSCEIGPSLGQPFIGHAHNALDDARSLAAGMEILVARSANQPKTLAPAA